MESRTPADAQILSGSAYAQEDPLPPPSPIPERCEIAPDPDPDQVEPVVIYLNFSSECLGYLYFVVSKEIYWNDPKFIKQTSERVMKVNDQVEDVLTLLGEPDLPDGVLYGQTTAASSQFNVVQHFIGDDALVPFDADGRSIAAAAIALGEAVNQAIDTAAAIIRGDEICDNGIDDDGDGDIDEPGCVTI